MKKVLILSSSPRRGGNSDTLCDEFMRGAAEAGNEVEKIYGGKQPFPEVVSDPGNQLQERQQLV